MELEDFIICKENNHLKRSDSFMCWFYWTTWKNLFEILSSHPKNRPWQESKRIYETKWYGHILPYLTILWRWCTHWSILQWARRSILQMPNEILSFFLPSREDRRVDHVPKCPESSTLNFSLTIIGCNVKSPLVTLSFGNELFFRTGCEIKTGGSRLL